MRLVNGIKKSVLASFLGALMVMGGPAYSTGVVTDLACDPVYMQSLKARAAMEAQREVMTNQRMIWKPDSVLALGCYKAWLDVMGQSFTADNQSGLTDTKQKAVDYLTASFNHGLGGGSLGFAAAPNPSDCSNMDQLWMAAKCKNLEVTDFLSLSQQGALETRLFPRACSGTGTVWAALRIMNNITAGGIGGTRDPMNLFTSIVGTKSDAGGTCNKLVVAGSTVCTNAGCNYDNGACK
ncbi:MAG: hypothetical protein JNK24_04585 [Alphaproteobacteria bacterium]|nr:hypothetical protein [Alphaproteobacteria bacterium]